MTKHGLILALATVSGFMSGAAYASDQSNLCFFNLKQPSANISMPADDAYHYPNTWTGPAGKTNVNDQDGFGQESTYKVSHWQAVPRGGGKPVRIDGFQTYVSLYGPSPFAGGQPGWIRLLWVSILGPDSVYRHWLYVGPGQFPPRQNGYELVMGGPSEFALLEVGDNGFVPLTDPTKPIGHSVGAGGTNMVSDFTSSDGFVSFHTTEESLKRVNYPFIDGYDPLLDYYWQRPYNASWGTLTYDGVMYDVAGTSWEERQWKFSLPVLRTNFRWHWTAIQIQGCLDKKGNKFACSETGRTILAWDNTYNATSFQEHYWNEVSPPPFCADATLTNQSDWSFTPIDYWTSPRTGIAFARTLRLVAPSRGTDLLMKVRVDDQEVWKAAFALPGLWEGGATVEGTINGKRVYGDAMLEQSQRPVPQ